MADAYRGLTIEFNGDATRLSKALTQVNTEMRTTGAYAAQVDKALKFNPTNTTLMAQNQKLLSREIELSTQKLTMLQEADKQAAAKSSVLTAEERDGWMKVQREIVTTSSQIQHYKQQLTESIATMNAHNSALFQAGQNLQAFSTRYESAGAVLQSAGRTLTMTLTPAVVALAGASVKTAMDFETSMSQLAGALDMPVSDISKLRELAIQTGKDTIYSATESGNAMVELAKGGLTEAQIEGGGLAATMNLAAAGNMELAVSADTVVQAMGAFHLNASQANEAVNALAGAANASSSDVSDLSQGLSQCSARANSAGWSIQDTTAVLAEFADSGVKGSDAGTSLKTMLQRLAAPTDDAAKAVSSLGIEVRDSNGNMKDASGVAQELKDKIGGLSSVQRDAALNTIFGSDASRAALILMDGGTDTLAKYTEATNDQSSAQRMADAQMGDGQRALENMKGSVETAAIQLGTVLAPTVTDVANKVGDAADAFSALDENQQKTVIGAAGIAAATGPVLSAGGKIIDKAKDIGAGVENMSKAWQMFKAESEVANNSAVSSAEKATSSIKLEEGAAKAMSATMGLAKLAVAGLAIAGVAVLVNEVVKAKQRQDDFAKSTTGLEAAVSNAGNATALQAGNTDLLGNKTKDATLDLDAFLQKQAQYTDTINQNNSAAQSNITMLQSAKDVIDQYAGKTDLSTEAQGKLSAAIQVVNDQCGTQYKVTDAANGVISDEKGVVDNARDAIDKYIDSKMQQIRVDALTQDLQTAYQAQKGDIDAVTQAQQDYNKALADKQDAEAKAGDSLDKLNGKYSTNSSEVEQARSKYETALAALNKAKGIQDSDSKSLQNLEDQLGLASKSADGAATSYQTFISQNYALQSAISASGGSLQDFQGDLATTGISTEQLNSLSQDQLRELGLSYDGTVSSITAKLWEFAGATEGPGADAAQKWKSGFDANTQGMIDAAVSASGMTLGQFELLASEAGVSGQDAIASLATSLSDPNGDATGATQKLMDAVALKMTGGNVEEASKIVGHDVSQGLANGIDQNAPDAQQKSLDMANGVIDTVRTAFDVHSPSVVFHDIGVNLGEGLANGINEGADEAASAADNLSKLSSDHMSSASVDAWYAGNNMAGDSFPSGISNGAGSAAGASDYISKLAADHMSSANGDAWWAGYNMAQGMADGISNNSISVVSASEVMASDAVKAAREKLDEHSPSKVMKQVGGFFSQGMAIGIEGDGHLAVESARKVALASARAAQDVSVPTVRAASGATVRVGNSTLSVSNSTDSSVVNQLSTLNKRIASIEIGMAALPDTIATNAPVVVQTQRQAQIAAKEALRGW